MCKRENTAVNACMFSIFVDHEWYCTLESPPWHQDLLILRPGKLGLKIMPHLLKYSISASKWEEVFLFWSVWFQKVTIRCKFFSKINHRCCNNKIGFQKKKSNNRNSLQNQYRILLIIKKFHIKLHICISRGVSAQDKGRELKIIMGKLRFQAWQQGTMGPDMNKGCGAGGGPCKSTPYTSLGLELCPEP